MSKGEDVETWLDDKFERSDSADAKILAESKSEAIDGGKQVFDLDKFYATYRTANDWSIPARVEQIRRWETKYYIDYADVQTIEEFARAVEAADVYEGGDMHIE